MDEVREFPRTGRFLMGRLRHAMSEQEKRTIEGLVSEVEVLPDATTILSRGQACDRSTMLIEGFMLRVIHKDDRRYVVSLQVPGDYVDLHAFALKRLDHDIITVGPTKVGFTPHERLREVMQTNPHLTRLLWFSTLLDAAIHREWIMTMERLPAANRAAHVFCELWQRLEFVGLAGEDRIETPLIQADLADMCGATAIHMNRALTQMRKDGLADFRRGLLRVADRKRLEAFGEFSPDYLYGKGELRLIGDLAGEK